MQVIKTDIRAAPICNVAKLSDKEENSVLKVKKEFVKRKASG